MGCSRGLTVAAIGAVLTIHVALTALDNLPDTKVSLGTRLPWLRKIPQWRFFAPNPGMEDLYVMYRVMKEGKWTKWTEFVFGSRSHFYSAVWNPGSRASKALFDMAHQLRMLAGFGSSFEWALGSEGYSLLCEVVRDRCVTDGAASNFQFMVLASVPADGPEGLKPIVVSPSTPILTLDRLKPTWI